MGPGPDGDLGVVRLSVWGWVAARSRPTRGSASLETALAIPSLLLVALVLLWGVLAGATNVQLAAAANQVARGLARGEAAEALVSQVTARLSGAQVLVDERGDLVEVTVREQVSGPGSLFGMLDTTLEQRATALREVS